jgi:hypothetical protein
MSSYKAKILWHDIWFKGPALGVAEYEGKKVAYLRNRDGKYEIKRFVDNGLEKVIEFHDAYRANCGHHQDHDPEKYGPVRAGASTTITSNFNYSKYTEAEIYAVLDPKDFDWFRPPNKHTAFSFNTPKDFDHTKVPGTDIVPGQEDVSDSDESDDDPE